uniref:Uncharacterized protein n=1 Tax=Anguilla anguilla TaxID=7936 RepID=A0A0E9UKV4_ANGAN
MWKRSLCVEVVIHHIPNK